MSASWWSDSAKAIVIRRVDVERVHNYARDHCCLRDYLIVRLPIQIGLRCSEIATLKIENIDFQSRSFQVLDSKKKEFFPLPLDVLTLQLIQDLIGDRKEGYVFRQLTWQHKKHDKPLSRGLIWHTIQKIAKAAGVKGFSPRICRHYFSCKWFIVEHKNLEVLRRILRHRNLATTSAYVQRLCFFEDIQTAYEGVRNEPVIQQKPKTMLNEVYHKFCADCNNTTICNIKDKVCASEWATGCKFYVPKQQVKVNGR